MEMVVGRMTTLLSGQMPAKTLSSLWLYTLNSSRVIFELSTRISMTSPGAGFIIMTSATFKVFSRLADLDLMVAMFDQPQVRKRGEARMKSFTVHRLILFGVMPSAVYTTSITV